MAKRPKFNPTSPQPTSGEFPAQNAHEYARMVTSARSMVLAGGIENLGVAMITSEREDRITTAALAAQAAPRHDDDIQLDIRGSEGLEQAYDRARKEQAVRYAIDNGTGAPVL